MAMFCQSLYLYDYVQDWYKHWIYISVIIFSIVITNDFLHKELYFFTVMVTRICCRDLKSVLFEYISNINILSMSC